MPNAMIIDDHLVYDYLRLEQTLHADYMHRQKKLFR